MNVFEHYLEGAEREAYIEDFTFENNMARLDTLYEMTNLQLSQMYRDAELKVLTECGTYDDFQYLIEEADKEAGEKKQGIIASIFTAIGELLKKIGNAITGLFNKKDSIPDNATIEIPNPVYTASKEVEKLTSSVSNGVAALSKGDTATAVKILGGITIPTLAIGGGAIAYKKISKNEAFNILDSLKKARDTVNNGINSVIGFFKKDDNQGENNQNTQDAKKQDEGKEASGPIKKFTTLVKDLIKYFEDAINKVTGKGNDGNQEGNTDDNNDKQNKAGTKPEGNQSSGEGVNQMKTIGDWTYYIDTTTGDVSRTPKGSSQTPVKISLNEIGADAQTVKDTALAIKNKSKEQNGNKAGDNQKDNNAGQTGEQNGQKPDNNQSTNQTSGTDNNGQNDNQNGQNNTNNQDQPDANNQQNDQNAESKAAANKVYRGNKGKLTIIPSTGTVIVSTGKKKKKYNNIVSARQAINNIGLGAQYNTIVNDYKQMNESVGIDEIIRVFTESGCEVVDNGMTVTIIPTFEMACVGYLVENGYDACIEDGKIVVNECVDTSRQESIFGVDYSGEYTESVNSAFDEELDELSEMFAKL